MLYPGKNYDESNSPGERKREREGDGENWRKVERRKAGMPQVVFIQRERDTLFFLFLK